MHFILSNELTPIVDSPPSNPEVARWQPLSHRGQIRPSLILLALETWHLPRDVIREDDVWFISFCAGLPAISPDGLEVEMGLIDDSGRKSTLLRYALRVGDVESEHSHLISLHRLCGRSIIPYVACLPGPNNEPGCDWLAIRELVIGSQSRLSLNRARAFYEFRRGREAEHFAVAFDGQEMFRDRAQRLNSIDALIPSARSASIEGGCRNAFDLAHIWLGQRGSQDVPDFQARLQGLSARLARPVRLASLCAGMATNEAALIRGAGVAVDLTLVDDNGSLVERAQERLAKLGIAASVLRHDVNKLDLPRRAFDVVLFVSGIHHVVELESVFENVERALTPEGELWLMGEQIGPNGGQLDPDCYERANRAFRALPAKYRANFYTGIVDTVLGNRDCAEATFEGIRSCEIEAALYRHFQAVDVCRRNSFLWRIVGPEYVQNYNIDDDADREVISSLVAAELECFDLGGRPTEMHGIFVPSNRPPAVHGLKSIA